MLLRFHAVVSFFCMVCVLQEASRPSIPLKIFFLGLVKLHKASLILVFGGVARMTINETTLQTKDFVLMYSIWDPLLDAQ